MAEDNIEVIVMGVVVLYLVWGYLVGINLAGFVVMGVDKRRAIKGAWRISETSLFTVALLGGALGCTLGMKWFRHKTRHWYFKYGMPAIFVGQVLLGVLVYHTCR